MLRRTWEARKGLGARPLVLLAPAEDNSRVRVCGPQHARPVRELPADRVLALLEHAAPLHFNEAASMLTREFIRLEESTLPGLRVKELLTPHFVRERLPPSQERLETAIEGVTGGAAANWRPPSSKGLDTALSSYSSAGTSCATRRACRSQSCIRQRTLMRSGCSRRMERCPRGSCWPTVSGMEPAGACWRRGPVSAVPAPLAPGNRFCLGLLAPASLGEDGWLAGWAREARDFGEQLRVGLERRLIEPVLPAIARGLGEHLESRGVDPGDPEQLRLIAEATLTLVFRFMFLLHVEARGYLPVDTAAYRPRSATVLAEDCRNASVGASPSEKSSQYWDRLRTLVGMIRTGDEDAGVPPYNGYYAKRGVGVATGEEAQPMARFKGPRGLLQGASRGRVRV